MKQIDPALLVHLWCLDCGGTRLFRLGMTVLHCFRCGSERFTGTKAHAPEFHGWALARFDHLYLASLKIAPHETAKEL